MIRESLILGTLWYALSRAWTALARSAPGRRFDALCHWFGRQWRESAIVGWFCAPRFLKEGARELGRVRTALCALYERLRLPAAVRGSIFLRPFLWCALAAALAPLVPTMALLGLAALGGGSLALTLLHERERRLAPFPPGLPVLLYALCYLVATFTSVNVRGSLYVGLLSVAFVLFSFVVWHAVTTREQLDLLVALLVTAGAGVSCYGILQYFFRWGYQSTAWVDKDMFSAIRFRVSATLQNPNMLGEYLILMIPLGGAKLLAAKGARRKLYYLACCGAMCACMLLTFSRGAWLGLLLAGLAFFVLLRPRLLFLAPLAVLALYLVLPETVVSRFTSIGDLSDHSTSYRVNIWLGTLRMLRDGYWLRGIGPGDAAFNAVYPFYSYETVVAPHAHNLFLQITCDAGILGLASFLWVLLRYFRTLCCALRTETDGASRLLQTAFTAGMFGFLVQAMTDYSFYNYRVMLLFWVYAALGALCARRSQLPQGGIL